MHLHDLHCQYNYNQFQGRQQQVISEIEIAGFWNLQNWNWNFQNWNRNCLGVMELELKVTELELNWKNGFELIYSVSVVWCFVFWLGWLLQFLCSWTFIWKYNNSIFFPPSCCCDLLAVVPGLSPASRLPRPLREGDPVPVSPRLN